MIHFKSGSDQQIEFQKKYERFKKEPLEKLNKGKKFPPYSLLFRNYCSQKELEEAEKRLINVKLPVYYIIKEDLKKDMSYYDMGLHISIYPYVDKSITEEQLEKLCWYIYKTEILTDPRYKISLIYAFNISPSPYRDNRISLSNLVQKNNTFWPPFPKYHLNEGVLKEIRSGYEYPPVEKEGLY